MDDSGNPDNVTLCVACCSISQYVHACVLLTLVSLFTNPYVYINNKNVYIPYFKIDAYVNQYAGYRQTVCFAVLSDNSLSVCHCCVYYKNVSNDNVKEVVIHEPKTC